MVNVNGPGETMAQGLETALAEGLSSALVSMGPLTIAGTSAPGI